MEKQQYCVFNTREKAERVICGLSLDYRLRWRSYDTCDDEGYLKVEYWVWYTPKGKGEN
jgi:hypothetical protein